MKQNLIKTKIVWLLGSKKGSLEISKQTLKTVNVYGLDRELDFIMTDFCQMSSIKQKAGRGVRMYAMPN